MKTAITDQVQEIAMLLSAGEVVAFPTETVYGLAAPIFSEKSVRKIFSLKGRPQDNPLIAHISSLAEASRIANDLPSTFFQLAEKFFPGPLTLVVNKSEAVPGLVSGNLPTIAIRMPAHPLASALIDAVGEPLVAPSANLSGKPSSTTPSHVLQDFDEKIPAILDGGACKEGIESTVIDLVSFNGPTILRPGSISKEAIEKVLGVPVALYVKGPKSAPGMRYRHYAPEAPIHLFSDAEAFASHLPKGKTPLILSTTKELTNQSLYSFLRKADTEGYDEVIVYCNPKVHPALWNRLEKASEELENYESDCCR